MTWIRLHLHPGDGGARTKRVSVLIGNHQPIGATRTRRMSVLDGDCRVPGSRRSHGSEGPHLRGHFTRAFMTSNKTSGCDGLQSFPHSPTCLVLL